MKRTIRALATTGTVLIVAAGTTAVVAAASGPRATTAPMATAAAAQAATKATDPLPAQASPTSDLDRKIAALQGHLRAVSTDATGWATLGLYYVEAARRSVNPAYYPKAEGALKTSLDLEATDNFIADAGEAALASARHDFATALTWARKGVAVNPYNAALQGALADAQTQLGMYDEAAASVQRMVDLRPGTPALARASYVNELRGDVTAATSAMAEALGAAGTPADKAFADYYLGELAFNAGDPTAALRRFADGIAQDPSYAALYEGRAKAEAALGQVDEAVKDFADAVARVPQPTYVLEFGDYLTSLGRTSEAQQQYKVFLAENELFTSNGVQLDTDATLYYADHGDAAKALAIGKAGIASRPFLEMHDAYGWALHANGRDTEALAEAHLATKPGMRNALFYFHLGMIEKSLGHTAAARADLTKALAINAHFNPVQVPIARAALTALGASS